MTNNLFYQEKQWLAEQMDIHGTAKAVANEYGFGESTIQKWAKKHGLNKPTTNPEDAIYKNKDWLVEQFSQGKTMDEVAKMVNVAKRTIQRQTVKYGLDLKELKSITNHPYKNEQWLKEQLAIHKNGNQIAYSFDLPANSVNRWINKYNLLERNQAEKITLEMNHDFFETIDSEEKAYYLGFLMADGNVCLKKQKSGKIGYSISLKLKSTDISVLEGFKKALESNARISEFSRKYYSNDVERGKKYNGRIYHSVAIVFASEKMANDLAKYGIVPRKTGKEIIPKDLIPENLLNHFVRGYFDGDGCSSEGIFSQCAGGDSAKQLKEVLVEQAGVSEDAVFLRKKKDLNMVYVNRKAEVSNVCSYMYHNATVYLERKKINFVRKNLLSN